MLNKNYYIYITVCLKISGLPKHSSVINSTVVFIKIKKLNIALIICITDNSNNLDENKESNNKHEFMSQYI